VGSSTHETVVRQSGILAVVLGLHQTTASTARARRVTCLRVLLAVACGSGVCVPAAWGGDVPSDAIAIVGDVPISRVAFDHWLVVEQKSLGASAGQASPPLDPPDFIACAAFRRLHDGRQARAPTQAELVAECRADYVAARDAAASFLITAEWLVGEAAEQGVTESEAEAESALASTEAEQFPTAATLAHFLVSSGETRADLLFRVRIEALLTKLRAKAAAGAAAVTPSDVAAYYMAHTTQFGTPERRDLRIVVVRTAAQARRVRALLAAGVPISRLAHEYSINAATSARGGALPGVVRGHLVKALDAAIFGARRGRSVGPIRTARGFAIFRVERITPAGTQTLAQATGRIRTALTTQRQADAVAAYGSRFEAKWRARTTCADGFTVEECSNASVTGLATLPASSTPPTPTTVTRVPRKPVIAAQHGRPPSHLVRRVIAVGHGRAARDGDTLTVRYVVKLWTGKLIDDSWAAPFTFTLGTHEVIRGFEEGLRGIRPGGRRLLTVPPALAYGSHSQQGIPGGSTLVFAVEAVSVTPP
jgi:foldase protein PrsA